MANWRKRLTSLASSVAGGVSDIASTATDDIGDTLSRARSYLNQNAPVLGSTYEAGLRLTPAAPLADLMFGPDTRANAPVMGIHNPILSGAAATLANVRDLGAPVREPLAFGARAAFGDLDPGDTPLSGRNFQKAEESVKGLHGLARVGGEAGLTALDIVTDPKSYLPGIKAAEGAGFLGKAAAHVANLPLAGFGEGEGARALGSAALRAGVFGLGSGGGAAAADEYTNIPGAGLIGGLAGGMGASMGLERALGRSASTLPEAIVPGDVARRQPGSVNLPNDDVFRQAVANTPGTEITADGLRITVSRAQKEAQAGSASVRSGVFYMPGASDNPYIFRPGQFETYGGTQQIAGDTLLRRPLVVEAQTGGGATIKA